MAAMILSVRDVRFAAETDSAGSAVARRELESSTATNVHVNHRISPESRSKAHFARAVRAGKSFN
jgi:hypothetical protein